MITANWPSRAVLLLCVAGLGACASTGGSPNPDGQWPYPVPPSSAPQESAPPPVAPTPLPPVVPTPPPTRPSLPPPSPTDLPPPLLQQFPRSIEASGSAAPVLALVRQSREAKKHKKWEQGEAALERALRIEPRNPWIWQHLASLHLAMGEHEQAQAEARKSNSLAKRNPWLEVENYRVLAASAAALGNAAAASAAQQRYNDRQRWITTPPYANPKAP